MHDTQAFASQQSGACASTGAGSTRPWQASNQVPQGADAVVAASLEIPVHCAAHASSCMVLWCDERMCLRRGRASEMAPPAVRRRGKHRTAGGTSGNHELIGRTILYVTFCMASALVSSTTEHGARLGLVLGSCEPRLLLGLAGDTSHKNRYPGRRASSQTTSRRQTSTQSFTTSTLPRRAGRKSTSRALPILCPALLLLYWFPAALVEGHGHDQEHTSAVTACRMNSCTRIEPG